MISALACLVFVAILVTCIPKDWSYLDVKEQTEEKETVLIVCCYTYQKVSALSIELGTIIGRIRW